ncbi:MAG: M20 family metallopeptidase [Candidatus Methylomirabilales bacterium]
MKRSGAWAVLSVLILLLGVLVAPGWASSEKILAAIDGISERYNGVSQAIHGFKEVGQQEFKSSALLKEELQKLGFAVTGDLKVPADLVKDGVAKTAFRAELKGAAPGPTITIMLEYDALANGHSCGHNLIATSGLLAAAGLAQVMKETPGRILVIGTPDEERGSRGGGKVALLEGGHFEGSDIVLITHPEDKWTLDQRFLAMKRTFFGFKGRTAHAAASPHKGINALRGVIQTFNNVDALREHLRQDVRIHGIVTKGGEAVNVVPEYAQAEFAVRALDTTTMEDAYQKVVNAAKAAALSTGATLEYKEPRVALKAPVAVPPLNALIAEKLKALGVRESDFEDKETMGSSDLGNVANAYPTVNVSFKIAPKGTAGHSDAFRDAAATPEAWKATVRTGKALALAAYDLLTQPAKVKEIAEKFQELKKAEGK